MSKKRECLCYGLCNESLNDILLRMYVCKICAVENMSFLVDLLLKHSLFSLREKKMFECINEECLSNGDLKKLISLSVSIGI